MGTGAISCKQLGDTLLLQPALAHLAARDGVAVDLYTNPAFAPLVELMPGARLPERGGRYGQLWVFEQGSKAARQAFVLRAREKRVVLLREKYRQWFHRWVFSGVDVVPRMYGYRAEDFFLAVGGVDFQPPMLRTPPPEWMPAVELPSDFLLIGPTSAWESKAWSPAQWAQLVDALDALDVPVVMAGGGSEWELRHTAEICAALRRPVVNLVGRTSLRELFAVVAKARAVVAIDGAMAHIAAALRRPSLALFGPTRSEEWHWPGPRSLVARAVDHCTEKRPPLTRLPETAVIAALRRLLE